MDTKLPSFTEAMSRGALKAWYDLFRRRFADEHGLSQLWYDLTGIITNGTNWVSRELYCFRDGDVPQITLRIPDSDLEASIRDYYDEEGDSEVWLASNIDACRKIVVTADDPQLGCWRMSLAV